jgi:hypothetical protein
MLNREIGRRDQLPTRLRQRGRRDRRRVRDDPDPVEGVVAVGGSEDRFVGDAVPRRRPPGSTSQDTVEFRGNTIGAIPDPDLVPVLVVGVDQVRRLAGESDEVRI